MRVLSICGVLLLAGCGDNLVDPPDAMPRPDASQLPTAVEYYGLKVGAHWTFASGVEKRITSCEIIPVYDCSTQTYSFPRVSVRETWAQGTLVELHYLRVEPGVGVVRVREDHPPDRTSTTWIPYTVRVVEGPYVMGNTRTFATTRCDGPKTFSYDQLETIEGTQSMTVAGTTYLAQGIKHGTEESWYVRGVGEIEELRSGTVSEQVVSYEPGYAECP